MARPRPVTSSLPFVQLVRRVDLWLWRLFGQGARLQADRRQRGRVGTLSALLTALGLSLSR